jgi:hypothetical protein
MPLNFLDEAFLTATYLINMLPSKVINNDTLVHRLLGTQPLYSSLRVFRCACWPNLRPYIKRKLAFRSTQCVFGGYSPSQKGVKCLEVSTGRVYISRDVVFDEDVFPFKNLHPNARALLRKEILLLDPSLHNFVHGNEQNSDHHDDNIPTTNPAVSTPFVVPQGSPVQGQAAGENLVENDVQISLNSSHEIMEEEDSSIGHEVDSLPTSTS